MNSTPASATLRAELTKTTQTVHTLEETIRQQLGYLQGAVPLLPAELQQRFTAEEARVNALYALIPAPLRAPWQSDFWQSFEADGDPTPLEYYLFGQLPIPMPDRRTACRPVYQPLLRAEGAIILLTDDSSLDRSRALQRDIVLRTATLLPGSSTFTLFDPKGLGATFPFEANLPRTRKAGSSIGETLTTITQDIQRINQRVVGGAGRFLDLTKEARSGESFEIIAVVDFPSAYEREPRALELLTRIGVSGPRAGRHLILEYNTSSPLPRDFDMKAFENAVVIDCRAEKGLQIADFATHEVIERLLDQAETHQRLQSSNSFNALAPLEKMMSASSAERIETPVGERLNILFGKHHSSGEVAHGVIAGQVGSGKSHLLHVIISGLTSRYSPEELKLYLLDAKHGVEFKVYKDLPHAEVVSLRTRPAIARKILADFHAEMKRRYELFKDENVNNLAAWRSKTGKVLPRMLLIIDEYQLIFEGDAAAGMDELGPILRMGRAAGTHLLLCAQRFDVEGMRSSNFNEIHLRASLSLAQDYIQTISAFGTEGKRLIRDLAASGELVINAQSGRDGDNHRGAVARLARRDDYAGANGDQPTLESVIESIVSHVGPQASGPIMLDGTMASTLADNAFVMQHRVAPPSAEELQRIAALPLRDGGFEERMWTPSGKPIGLWLGRNFDVRSHALCTLRRGRGQNMLMVGSRTELRATMLANMLVGLPATVAPQELDLTVIDALDPYLPGGGIVNTAAEYLRGLGAQVTLADASQAEAALTAFADAAHSRQGLLILCEPDRIDALVDGYDPYGAPESGLWATWRDLVRRGSDRSRHVIVSAESVTALQSFMNPSRDGRDFIHRVVQQLSADDSMTLFSSLAATQIEEMTEHPLAAMYVDLVKGERARNLFSSYAFDHDISREQTREQLQVLLATAFGEATVVTE
ncbi:FtsK/SpoIIIE domain-containing protein [Duffyella gerundensis]|uniref:FtsK/SpoIIIE domain-containing protein n=1 Tax=Duffyella TaxID=3026546 RepID=UPI003F6E1690